MLQFMRSASKTWLMRAFFAILVFSFAILWGVGDVWQPGGGSAHTVATVGKETISTYDYVKAYQRRRSHYQANGQQPNEATLKSEVLEVLVFESLLNQESKRLGLAISDEQLRAFIKNSSNFKDQTKNFNMDLFNAVARSEGMTEAEFTEEIRAQLRRNQLLQTLTSGIEVPQSYLDSLFKFQNEKRVVEWAMVSPDKVKNIPVPTDEDLAKYFEENKQMYAIPEARDFTVLVLSETQAKQGVELSEEEIQQAFQLQQGQFKGPIPTKEETARVIDALKAEKAADKFNRLSTQIEDDIAAGESLESIAEASKLTFIKVEGLQRDGDAKAKPALTPVALLEIVGTGFDLEVGDDPTLTQLENGEMIAVRIDKVSPMREQTLEEVKTKVAEAVKANAADKAAREQAEDIVKAVNTGIPLKQIAGKQKLTFNSNITLERVGKAGDKTPLSIRVIAFKTDLNQSSLAPVSDGYAVVLPTKSIEPVIENRQDEMKIFADNIDRAMSNDMLEGYWNGLRRHYPLDVNQEVLKRMEN